MNNFCKTIFSSLLGLTLAVSASALDLPVKTVNGVDYYFYEVKQRESIYSLCKSIGVSRADILRYNPSVIDGLRPKQVLLFPVSEFSDGEHTSAPLNRVEVCPEETEAPSAPEPIVAVPDETDDDGEESVEDAPRVTYYESEVVEEPDSNIRLAVILPFMLDAERLPKSAENYTEFYRGLLMAVDTMAARHPELRISVAAFDSEGSAERVATLAAATEVRNATYVIAPDDSLSIEALASVADRSGATVVNLFAVRNDAHERHPSVYQANIPQSMMYGRAIDGFIDSFKGYTPVFLTATDISADKSSFTEALQHRLDSLNVDFEEIEFTGEMAEVAIGEQLDANGRYVFVPASASREMLARVLPALAGLRERALVSDDVRLFGYPEWIILRGEQSLKLHQLNTLIYSRFASDAESYPTRRVSLRYEELFGSKMGNAVPVYGLLGFDAGCWMLGRGANYTGLQNSFTSGDVNTALYFINFAPDGNTNLRCAD